MATHEERLADSIRQLAAFSVVDGTMTETLHRIAVLANSTLEGSAMVGLTLSVQGDPATPVFTDEDAPEIDSVQYKTGVGPCLDSFRNGVSYSNPSTATDTRWPTFSAACLARGILSTLSVPVLSKDEKLGAANFYSRSEGAFTADDETVASAFAAQAAVVIGNSRAYRSARDLGEQLTQALESRAAIEQAKGLLMSTGVNSDQAFELLRKASQRENRKLRDIAVDLVADAERRATSRQASGTHPPVEDSAGRPEAPRLSGSPSTPSANRQTVPRRDSVT